MNTTSISRLSSDVAYVRAKVDSLLVIVARISDLQTGLERVGAELTVIETRLMNLDADPLAVTDLMTVTCGGCGERVKLESFTDHVRSCAAAKRKAIVEKTVLRSAVLEEAAMDGLHGRQLEI